MKKAITLTEAELENMILEVIEDFNSTRTFNIYPVWHCGEPLSEEKFKDVIWFSDKPLGEYFGKPNNFMISMHKPLIVPTCFDNWTEKLWGYCCDENGVPKDSQNHYAMGAVVSWLFSNVGGLTPMEPGFAKVSVP